MDPVSIVMLTNASFGIARSLVHTIKELYELAEAYETAALGIRTVATQCNSFRVAIQRIHSWLTTQDESSRYNLDEDFWQALADNLETGRLVLDDLEKRIAGLKKDSAKFWTRTKYLWNSVVISELQSQIQGLMSAVSLLVQVIDIPTTGGKRSQSLAQRSRLNNITKTVRLTVDQRRERIRQTQEQSLLDDVDNDSASGALQDPLPSSRQLASQTSLPPQNDSTNSQLQQRSGDSPTRDSAPPPYEFYNKDQNEIQSKSMPTLCDSKKPPEVGLTEQENSSRVLDRPESKDPKPKRSIWTMGFKKRSSTPRVEQVSRSASDSRDSGEKDAAEASTISQILNPFDDSNSQTQHTPAIIEPSREQQGYFGLQEAAEDMSMPRLTQTLSADLVLDRKDSREPRQGEASNRELDARKPTGYEALSSLSDRSKSTTETATTTTSYYPPAISPPTSPPTNPYASLASKPPAFDRIRPSQRVREARERSRSPNPARTQAQTTSPDLPTRSLTPAPPATTTTQTWRTTALLPTSPGTTASSLSTTSHTRLKITFSPTLYTSRISLPAARALHLLEHAETNTIDGVPIATLTLLYPVSDGDSQTVLADEVELEVMHEGESRGLEIVFGAAQGHIAGVMEGGEAGCLWWSERGVPRGLRTVEGLRLFRKFELSRW